MKRRALIVGGLGSVAVAVTLLIFGSPSAAILTFVFLGIGTALLLVGLAQTREQEGREPRRRAPSLDGRPDRAIWIGGAVLAGLAAAAAVVAATVAVGDATGHAVGHLAVGLACLILFVGVAAAWHPTPGSGKASIRGMVLLVLGVGAFGSFIESLGGAGYDAANIERRVESLTALHGIGVLFGPVALLAIPLGLVTLLAVGFTAAVAKVRHSESFPTSPPG
jgi:hypothetical protein